MNEESPVQFSLKVGEFIVVVHGQPEDIEVMMQTLRNSKDTYLREFGVVEAPSQAPRNDNWRCRDVEEHGASFKKTSKAGRLYCGKCWEMSPKNPRNQTGNF